VKKKKKKKKSKSSDDPIDFDAVRFAMRFGFDATTGFGIPQKSDSDLREREGNAVTGVWVGICVPQKKK